MGKLDEEESWPVTISYFDDVEKDGLPVYHTSFLYMRMVLCEIFV